MLLNLPMFFHQLFQSFKSSLFRAGITTMWGSDKMSIQSILDPNGLLSEWVPPSSIEAANSKISGLIADYSENLEWNTSPLADQN